MKLGTYWRGWLSLAVGIGITCVVVFLFKQERDRVEEAQFLFECKEITNRIDLRLHANAQLLRCGAAFLDASDAVDRNDWYKFVQKSRIEQELPGILGTGFSLIIPYKDLNAHTQLIREMGFPDYSVWPNYKRDVYTSTVMVEPFTQRNIRSFGYDMFTDPVRREAMQKARDLDEPVLSGKVKLVQETETDLQAGCLMYVPVYQKGKSIETVEERQKSIVGWVFSPYRMKDLIWGILNDWDLKKGESALQLSIYDGAVNAENSLLFVSHEEKNIGEGLQFGGQSRIDFNGREWILVFRQERGSLLTVYKGALLAAIGGLIISILMMLLTRSFVETKRRALQMAEQLTVELREQERQLNESQEIARLGRYSLNITEGLWTSSDILDDIFGIDFQKVHQFDEWVNILHPDDREWMIDYFNQFISDKGLFNKEYRILRRSDQQLRWVHGLGKLELDDHQVPVRMVGTMRDITEKKQIEKSLEESHEKYQGLFNNSPLGIYKTTEEGAILDANPALLEMMEYDSLEELQQRGVSVNSYSHNSAVTRDDFIEMISKEGFVKGLEGCWLTKNGKEIHIRESARAVEGTNGLSSCFEGTVEDITEKKLADKEFKDVTNRLQLATSAASIGIWDRNLEGKTSIWDKTMYRLFGCSPDDSLSPDAIWQNAISKEERKRLNFEIQSVLRGEKNYNTEFKIVWPDKSVHYLKGYGFVSYDEDGNPSRLLGVNMDITEQKRAEQIIKKQHEELEEKVAERTRELTVSEQKLKESIKEITDYKFALDESSIVATTDNRGVINYANETFCRISKYNLGELIGNTHRVVNSKYHSNDFFIDLWSTISSGKVWRGEIKNRAKDDSIYWVDSTIVPFLDENGKPYQYIAIRFDITTKK
ncbi:CHASE domain-containing protein [Saccharicrinis fermentans]|uniref:histidine kinase n=2 Tax=Saccharicrinis fermentans TaxID=982 RepID=W7Y3U5_9BACT|nr:CHASE domain-containing protein [Saccharicrinis fermentans]GAF02702.1 nitrogen fixation regulatory protein [Saccharicrinis fermentans DSM 9555 = JCM 21142]